jgi:hypothetical protein
LSNPVNHRFVVEPDFVARREDSDDGLEASEGDLEGVEREACWLIRGQGVPTDDWVTGVGETSFGPQGSDAVKAEGYRRWASKGIAHEVLVRPTSSGDNDVAVGFAKPGAEVSP